MGQRVLSVGEAARVQTEREGGGIGTVRLVVGSLVVRPDSKSDTQRSAARSVQFQSPPTMARAASCDQGSASKNVARSSALAEAGA